MLKINIKTPVNEAISTLKEQQRDIIVKRYSLKGVEKKSLQQLANKYNLTCERIRQIQLEALNILREDECVKFFAKTIKYLEKALDACGGVADENSICNVCNIVREDEKAYVKFLLEIGENFNKQEKTKDLNLFWFSDFKKKEIIEKTLKNIQKHINNNKNNVYTYDEMINLLKENRSSKKLEHHESVLNLLMNVSENKFGEWGYSKNENISLSNVKGYIVAVLKMNGKPMHFFDITKEVTKIQGKKCHVGSCHNELVKGDAFVLVGRGIYALKSMGYTPGTIKDIIIKNLKKRGGATKEQIVNDVLNERIIEKNSVVQILNREKCFIRNSKGKYTLA